jgi:Zn-dependent M16 (insulinase) family peptidase
MGSYDNGIYQPIFSVIAKNANEEQKEEFIQVIEDVLRASVKNGIDTKAIEAGINYYEFRYREADFGNYPKGLMYGLQMMDSWLYDEEKPFIHIEALDTFEFLKKQIGTGYYEELIQKYLLDNTHGAIVIVTPEKGRTARMEAELEEKLQKYKESLTAEEVEAFVQKTQALEAYQSEPESEENLEKIPVLKREDISREIEPIINEEMTLAGVPVIFHEIETNGIGYVDVLFDMSLVEEQDLPYVGILQSVLGIIDTKRYDYGTLFNEINVNTGGISTSLELYNDVTNIREKAFKATFEIKGKALYGKLPVAFDMMREILMESKLNDGKRIREILAMLKSRLLMKFQSSGHVTAVLRAQSYASPAAKLKDMTNGIAFYETVSYIEEHFEEEKEKLSEKLIDLSKKLFCGDNMMLSYTAAREGLEGLEEMVEKLKNSLHTRTAEEDKRCVIHCEKKNEGFKTASKVQYVAKAGNFIDLGVAYTGALQILKVIMSYDYLWQNIRVKGGAYGCMSNFNRIGEGYFVSYRDPNLKRTLDVYDGVVDYLKSFTVSERDMTKYIIGTMSGIDQPMTPASKGERSMNLYMNKVSAEMIREERNQILDAEQDDIRALYKVAEAVLQADQMCVIGGEDKIEEEKELFKTLTSF